MRFNNWSTFRIEVSSRLISVSSVSCRAWRDTLVYSRAFSMPTAMREANSVSSRLCSSVKAPGCAGFNVDHADDLVLGDQRNRQFGTHAGRRVDEVLFGRDVVDQHRLAQLRRPCR